MELFQVPLLTQNICSSILLICYLITLIHVKRGSNYKSLQFLVLLLFLSNLATILVVNAQSQIIQEQRNKQENEIILWCWVQGIG